MRVTVRFHARTRLSGKALPELRLRLAGVGQPARVEIGGGQDFMGKPLSSGRLSRSLAHSRAAGKMGDRARPGPRVHQSLSQRTHRLAMPFLQSFQAEPSDGSLSSIASPKRSLPEPLRHSLLSGLLFVEDGRPETSRKMADHVPRAGRPEERQSGRFRIHRVAPLLRWFFVIRGFLNRPGDTVPSRSHNVRLSMTTGLGQIGRGTSTRHVGRINRYEVFITKPSKTVLDIVFGPGSLRLRARIARCSGPGSRAAFPGPYAPRRESQTWAAPGVRPGSSLESNRH